LEQRHLRERYLQSLDNPDRDERVRDQRLCRRPDGEPQLQHSTSDLDIEPPLQLSHVRRHRVRGRQFLRWDLRLRRHRFRRSLGHTPVELDEEPRRGRTAFAMSIGNLAFYLLISIVWAAPARGEDIAHADALFGERDDTAKLRQAIAVLESGPRGNDTFDVLWRLAKYRYYESGRRPDPRKQAEALKGTNPRARRAWPSAPGPADGHICLDRS